MKNSKKWAFLGLVVLVALLGFIACEDKDDDPPPPPDPFAGTWVYSAIKFVAKNGSFTQTNSAGNNQKGTYTVSGNTVSLTKTHQWVDDHWTEAPESYTGTISGNTFVCGGITFTKQ